MLFRINRRLNTAAMLYLNFKMLPFRQAIRMPLRIYGPVRFDNLDGTITLLTEKPIIRIGSTGSEKYDTLPTILDIRGSLRLGDGSKLGRGSLITIEPKAELILGAHSQLSGRNKIITKKRIEIGAYTRISWETQIFDTNFHYTIREEDDYIAPRNAEVKIGDKCWVGNRCTISKGTKLPSHTIVASNSLVNKDFTQSEQQHFILAGSPAKIVKVGYRRLFESIEQDAQIIENIKKKYDE